jgi:ribonuclease R
MARHPPASRRNKKRARGTLPSAGDLNAVVREGPLAGGKRKIVRAFAVTRSGSRRLIGGPPLPELSVVERIGADEDGIPLARPVAWPQTDPAPILRLVEDGLTIPPGARAAARLVRLENGEIEARVIRRLDPPDERIVGVFHRGREGGRLVPADRRNRTEYQVAAADVGGADDGELVTGAEISAARLGLPRARIVERLGAVSDPGAISLLAIATFDIPTEFPAMAIAEAEAAPPISLDRRGDLRGIPLVTIDGSDARDFDDAVWAEPDTDPANRDGWHLVVAIADVAWYVSPGSALDREAERRGNSVYFPDRVVPMLPEALSNGLCSLKPAVDRACLAVHLWIDAAGCKRRHVFERAVIRSAARMTYEEVQAVRAGEAPAPAALPPGTLDSLYGAYAALARERARRGALELDLGEDRVVLDGERRPVAIAPLARLDSHRLIEEFMILANVAAAEELESRRQPCMYRIHDAPDPEKLAALADFLADLGVPGLDLAKGQAPKPRVFNRLLDRAAAAAAPAAMINELVLRCQAQAAYSPDNIGHFGLALRRYAHFTSPIRRYADLLVHRALIASANGTGHPLDSGVPLPDPDHDRLAAIGEHISGTERRAAAAERAAMERYRAMLMAPLIGTRFDARISGVAKFGLFATVAGNGAVGLVPVATLPGDYYDLDGKSHRLVGRRSRRSFRLGDEISVRLVEADPIGGRLVFAIDDSVAAGRREARRQTAPTGPPG